MKSKFLLSALFLLIITGLYSPVSNSQTPTFTCTLSNGQQITAQSCSFDVYIVRTGSAQLQLYSFQQGFTYNNAALNGGTFTSAVWSNIDATVVSNGMTPKPIGKATAGVLKCAASVSSGGPGTGPIVSNSAPGMRFGTITLTCSTNITFSTLGLTWCFATAQYATVVQGNIGDGLVTDITSSGTYLYDAGFTLPIELNTFMSNVSERQVNLSWETKTEVNSSKFEIERALTGTKNATVTWTAVGTVPASGSSNSPKKYSFTEKDLQAGKYQYKLKMIDNNGAYKFSDVVETEVALPKNFEVSQNYPNPFNPSTRINYSIPFDSKVTLEVFTITGERLGQIVNEEQSAGYYTVNFSSSTLHKSIASGVYIYRVIAVNKSTGNASLSIKKMILLK